MFFGADFSHHNPNPPIADKDFVILRAGYGKGNQDKLFFSNVDKARLAGTPFGVYWFSYALTPEMAIDEANFCINNIEATGRRPEYPIYFDFEYDSVGYFKKNIGRRITDEEIVDFAKAFCNRIEERGYYAGIYCNKEYMRKYKVLEGKYTIWLADWTSKAPGDFRGYPGYVHMRQYGENPYDQDVCKIDFPAVMRKAHLNGY